MMLSGEPVSAGRRWNTGCSTRWFLAMPSPPVRLAEALEADARGPLADGGTERLTEAGSARASEVLARARR